MKFFLLILVAVTPALALATDWNLVNEKDAMTDEERTEAVIENPDGDRFTILRRANGKVWGFLSLGGVHQFGIINSIKARYGGNQAFVYNDDLDKLSKKLGRPMNGWEWNPKLVAFLMWHGNIEEGCGKITELAESKQILFRYKPNQSTQRDVYFRDVSEASAIPAALGINLEDCPAD